MMIKSRQSGLSYSFGVGYDSDLQQTSFRLWDKTRVVNLGPLLELALGELAEIKADQYQDAELERAIGFQVGSLRRQHQTPAQYADWYGSDFVDGRSLISPEDFINQIQSTSRAEIKRVAGKYLNTDSWVLTVLARRVDEIEPQVRQLAEKFLP